MTTPKPKRIVFDDDVLDIFKHHTEWGEDGLTAEFTIQLDTKLYAKCKKAITAMKGKWVRAKNTHVFKTDPRPLVEGLLENGHLEVERDGFFETPPEVVDMMLDQVVIKDGMLILEPSAGKGAIILRTLEHGYKVMFHAVEKNPDRVSFLWEKGILGAKACDFLEQERQPIYDIVLMYPPFEQNQDIEHVRHAYEFLKPGGRLIAIMSPHFRFVKDKPSIAFRHWLNDKTHYEDDLPEGSFKASGTNVNTLMVIIDKPSNAIPSKKKPAVKAVKVHEELLPKSELVLFDLLDEMNLRAKAYSGHPASFIDKQVRQDFAFMGGKGKGILYAQDANVFHRRPKVAKS